MSGEWKAHSGERAAGSGRGAVGSGNCLPLTTGRAPLGTCRSARRSGVVLVLVLLVVCMALGLSYAAVRSQYTGVKIQQNAGRRVSARQAAVTGLTMAVKRMQTSSWGGPESVFSGLLGDDQGFEVVYSFGDASLNPDHPDYEDLPYRVTLLSTGYAADPDNPAAMATYQIRAVFRLVPRAFPAEPSDWSTMQQYTVYQSKKDPFEIDIPCRIEGAVRVQKKLDLAKHYPDAGRPWERYLLDLNQMRLSGLPDYRPVTGPVDLDYSEQDSEVLDALANRLVVPTNDMPASDAASDWARPTDLAAYQIYDGGPVYTIPTVGPTLKDVTLEPDPLTNPLGIYYRAGTVIIESNVTVRGSLFCKDDIRIQGTNVHFQPVDMPAMHGSEGPVRLPVASCKAFLVESTGGGDLAGLLAVFDTFEIKKSPETVEFAVTGRVIANKFYIKEREPWETLKWHERLKEFEKQEGTGEPYFPVWMGQQSRNPKPLLTVKPDSGPITYHWHYPGDRIYEPHPDDDGLRWDLIEWIENP